MPDYETLYRAQGDTLEHMEQSNEELAAKLAEKNAILGRLEFLLANAEGYAKLFEDAAKELTNEFDAALLRGLADRLREL